ncbi:MAG: hypothetical protein ACP5N9_06295 [Candidatus Bilamarchaeum sp.]
MIPKQYLILLVSVAVIFAAIHYAYSNNFFSEQNQSLIDQNSSLNTQNNSILLKCNDGTKINTCSFSNSSYYCNSNRELVASCDVCGCPNGLVCSNSICSKDDSSVLAKIDQSLVYIKTSYSNGSGVITAHQNNQTIVTTSSQVVRYAANLSDVKVTFVSSNFTTNPSKILVSNNISTLYINGLFGTPATINRSSVLLGQEVLAVGSSINGEDRLSHGTVLGIAGGSVIVTNPINPQIQGGGIFTVPAGELIGIAILDPSFEGESPAVELPNNTSNQSEWQPQTPACDCRVCDCG